MRGKKKSVSSTVQIFLKGERERKVHQFALEGISRGEREKTCLCVAGSSK